MQLFLLRHADADTVAASDDARFLSEKGVAQAKKVARFCEDHDLQLSLIVTSPIRRAHETAEIVAEHLRTELVCAPWLACGMRPEVACRELKSYRDQGPIMIVGHEPDFSALAACLLGTETGENIRFRKASLALFEVEGLTRGEARLDFCLPCRLM